MIHEVVAEVIVQQLANGHSKPCVVRCSDYSAEQHEVVLKFRSTTHGQAAGQCCELVAAQFARDLGLFVPTDSYIVEILDGFEQPSMPPDLQKRIKESVGVNYGSTHMTGPLFVSARVPSKLLDRAAEILLFDLWIKNVDRHRQKGNFKVAGNDILIFDHELAFPAVHSNRVLEAWEPGAEKQWVNHPFYRQLKGQKPDFKHISEKFRSLSNTRFEEYVEFVPDSWMTPFRNQTFTSFFIDLMKNYGRTVDILTNWLR